MGLMRLIHFIAAYTFAMSIIIRLYWSLFGNRHACLKTWFPFSGRQLNNIGNELKCYLLISKRPPDVVGHTALGGLTTLIIFAVFIFQTISGFAMYSVNHSGTLWIVLGGWLTGVMHLPIIRLFHHLSMYVMLSFALLHVYIAWFSDLKEKNGLMGSIFSGYKFATGQEQDFKE